jgi:predicted esterase
MRKVEENAISQRSQRVRPPVGNSPSLLVLVVLCATILPDCMPICYGTFCPPAQVLKERPLRYQYNQQSLTSCTTTRMLITCIARPKTLPFRLHGRNHSPRRAEVRLCMQGAPGGEEGKARQGDDMQLRSTFRRNEIKFHGRPGFQEPLVVPAAEEHTATLIFLHGFGSQGPGRGQLLAESLNIPWCKIVCPLAPQRPGVLGQSLQSWSSVDLLLGQRLDDVPKQLMSLLSIPSKVLEQVATGVIPSPDQVWGQVNEQVLASRRAGLTPIKGDSTDRARNVEFIKQLIRSEERAGIPPERVMLAGFSQGGCHAVACALQMHIRLGGVVALSTWFPEGEENTENLTHVQGMPLYIAHGDSDWIVPVELGRALDSQCRRAGFETRYAELEGLGHDVTVDVIRGVRRFVQERVPRVAPANVSVWRELAQDVETNDVNII